MRRRLLVLMGLSICPCCSRYGYTAREGRPGSRASSRRTRWPTCPRAPWASPTRSRGPSARGGGDVSCFHVRGLLRSLLSLGRPQDLLLLWRVREAVAGVEHGQVVHVLDVALFKVGRHVELLAQEVQRVERLGLRFRDGRDVRAARERAEADEVSPGILQDDALRGRIRGWVVVNQRPAGEPVAAPFLLGEAVPVISSHSQLLARRRDTHFSTSQLWLSVWIRSGLLAAR